jgi:DNA-binding transcriptional MocR family regulator
VRGDPRAFHLWLSLPSHWSGERYAAAAARNGVAVSPASAFAVGTSTPENGVRLALGSPPFARLDSALRTLRRLVLDGDEAVVE